jgi:hypothetical protein
VLPTKESGPNKAADKEKSKDFTIGGKSAVHLANDKHGEWSALTDKQKNYAYYLSEAGMQGARMIPH